MAAKKRRRVLWVTLTMLVLGSAAFFSLKAINNKPAKIDPEKLAKVERIDLARSVVATGKVQPVTQVEIKSKASGIIEKLPVNVGDIVHKGQLLCELDQNDLHSGAASAGSRAACGGSGAEERAGGLRAI